MKDIAGRRAINLVLLRCLFVGQRDILVHQALVLRGEHLAVLSEGCISINLADDDACDGGSARACTIIT